MIIHTIEELKEAIDEKSSSELPGISWSVSQVTISKELALKLIQNYEEAHKHN